MKLKRIINKLALFFLMLSGLNSMGQPSGYDIMVMVNERPDGDTRKSMMNMELINKRGSTRHRSMISYSKDYGKDKKTVMFFNEPADVKGTGFLTWDYDSNDKDDDRWLYLPAMKKTRRISGSSAKKEYFMGSDFTYDDLDNGNVDDDHHVLIGEEMVDGRKCWKIESLPIDQNEMYSKKIVWVCQESLIATKVEYYDKQDRLTKQLNIEEIKMIDGYWTATQMTMKNYQRNHTTILTFSSLEFDIDVEDNQFTVNTLEKGHIE